MSDIEFGDVHQAVQLLAGYSKPWAVCGGWAIDLFLNHVTRAHKDVDFAILRKDQLMIQKYLSSQGWNFSKKLSAANSSHGK